MMTLVVAVAAVMVAAVAVVTAATAPTTAAPLEMLCWAELGAGWQWSLRLEGVVLTYVASFKALEAFQSRYSLATSSGP